MRISLSILKTFEWHLKCWSLAVLFLAVASCSAQITRAPGQERYTTGIEEGGLRIDVAVVQDLKSDHSLAHDVISNDLRDLGMVVLDLKISNGTEYSYLVNRKKISLFYGNGKKLKAMSEKKTRKTTRNLVGLQIIYPDIKDKYRLWGLKDTIILSPGSEISGYVFFRAKSEFDDALNGVVSINAIRFYETELIEKIVPLQASGLNKTGDVDVD